MTNRWRFTILLLVLVFMAAFCASNINAQDRAKPRDKAQGRTQTERKRDNPPPEARRPRQHEAQPSREGDRSRSGDDSRARSDNARRRQPQPRTEERRDNNDNRRRDADRNRDSNRGRDNDRNRPGLSDARRRHPVPDGKFDRGRDNRRDWNRYHWRNWDRYRWRNWDRHSRYDRNRFPRFYFGLRLFDGRHYRGYGFGPHYSLWYYDQSAWQLFYWPYPYAPTYGCGWYWVPTDRYLITDPYGDDEEWEYTDYRYIYLCFN